MQFWLQNCMMQRFTALDSMTSLAEHSEAQPTEYRLLFKHLLIRLLNKKNHGLSPSGSHHSLLFDQGSQTMRNYSAIWPIRTPFDGILYQ
jgi:hypothetical protein